MSRVNVVVEGPTEVDFVREVLCRHLAPWGVFPVARAVSTSNRPGAIRRGGVSYYSRIHQDIRRWCRQDPGAKVTSMFDLYGLPTDFPRWEKASLEQDIYARFRLLEEGFAESVGCRNFIPYLQLHEFETLLFTNIEVLATFYPENADALQRLRAETDAFDNPEAINDRAELAPSKRIMSAIPGYRKKATGNVAVLEIGLEHIRNRCQHFGAWLCQIESLGTPPA